MTQPTPMSLSSAHLGLLAELPVSTDTTSSRVLVNNPLLRVVLFSFDAGQRLTEHTSPRAVVCQLISGEMSFTVGGIRHEMVAGDVIYLAPGEPHALEAHQPSHLSLVMIDTAADLVA